MNEVELAWSAGFLDGEGSFGSYRQTTGRRNYQFRIQCSQVQEEPLVRLQEALGGKVRGPYGPYATTKQAYYQWSIWGLEAVEATDKLKPYLCSVKIEQAQLAMEKAGL